MDDREGALADYNEALSITTDPDTIEYIKYNIEHIDVIRDANKSIKEAGWAYIKIILFIILVVILFVLKIFSIFNK